MVPGRLRRQILEELLAHGELRLPAEGGSMAPFFLAGDALVVRPAPSSLPLGTVLVFVAGDRLLAHRLIGREKDRLLVRGDAQRTIERVEAADVVGVVAAVQPAGRARAIPLDGGIGRLAGRALVPLAPLVGRVQAVARRILPRAARRMLARLLRPGRPSGRREPPA